MHMPERLGFIYITFIIFIALAVMTAAKKLIGISYILVILPLLSVAFLIFFLPKIRAFSEKHILAAIFIITFAAVIPRLIFLYFVKTMPVGDFQTYNLLANGIASGTLLNDTEMPIRYASIFPHTVAYPAFLSVFIMLYNNSSFWAELLSIVCFSASAIIVGIISEQLHPGNFLLSGLVFALFPSGIYYSALMTTESLFILLMLIVISAFIYFVRLSKIEGNCVIKLFLIFSFSVVLSIANAVRPLGYIILIASFFVLIFRGFIGVRRRILKSVMVFIVIVILYTATAQFLTFQTSALINQKVASSPIGFNLFVGLNRESSGQWNESDSKLFSKYAKNNKISPQEIHDIFLGLGISRAIFARKKLVNLAVSKFNIMWDSDSESISYIKRAIDLKHTRVSVRKYKPFLKNIADIYYFSILLMVLYSTVYGVITKTINPLTRYPMLIILGIFALHLIVEVAARYHMPALPLLSVLALPGMLNHSHRTIR